jgi:hypothetical protein
MNRELGYNGDSAMAFRPNYNQQRAERNRAKEQKKQERLQRREADATRRRVEGEEPLVGEDVVEPSSET